MHVARLKFPGPATEETWVTDAAGDPVFMVVAEPSPSLAGQLRDLLPALRQVAGEGRRVTVCFDRGGWSPALFADITGAGFDLLTYRKGPAPDLPAEAFTTLTCTDDGGRGTRVRAGRHHRRRWTSAKGRARDRRDACGRSPAASPGRAAPSARCTP